MDKAPVRGGLPKQNIHVGRNPSFGRYNVLNDQTSTVSQRRAVAWLGILSVSVNVMTSKRPDHVRSVPIIALPGCIVAVDARVEMENFSMVLAKLADSWVRGGRFSMRTGRRGCVSETGMVGVDPAVCYPYNDARGVQSQRPVGVVVKHAVLEERCRLPVSGMGFEDGFHPKDPVDVQNGLENLEVRRGHRERARKISLVTSNDDDRTGRPS